MNFPDMSKWGVPLMTSAAGAGFSIFSLIYNEKYIALGLITFAFGLIVDLVDKLYWNTCGKSRTEHLAIFLTHCILMLGWLILCIFVYQKI